MKFSLTDYREVRKFFIIFYVVGTLGMVIPYTQQLFIRLIPYTLLLNVAYLTFFHEDKKLSFSFFLPPFFSRRQDLCSNTICRN